MSEYDKIDVSKGIDINKIGGSHECIMCHYWYFLRINFTFQPEVWNGCHDTIQKSVNFNDFAIVTINFNDYRIYFWFISKDEAIDL